MGVALQSEAPARADSRRVTCVACRLALGGMFLLSGYMKLQDAELFAFAVHALRLGLADAFIERTAHVLPWTELITGACLVSGVWVVAATTTAVGLLSAFSAVVCSALVRGIDVDCSCFGSLEFFCTGPLGPCHLVRNFAMLAVGLVLLRLTLSRRRT